MRDDPELLEERRRALIAEHGPWSAHNVRLADGQYSIGTGAVGVAEARVRQAVQIVSDLAPRPLGELRILDLGCHEGGFALELAAHGAQVHAVDARPAHVAKAQFAKEALGLETLTVQHADVRDLDADALGQFDVVLCLGLLYHLDAPECFELMARVASLTRSLALVETQIALRSDRVESWHGRSYHGRSYGEDTNMPGASVRNTRSFWLTRPSLLNLLSDVGFTTHAEVRAPSLPTVAAYRDHVVLAAWRNARIDLLTSDDPHLDVPLPEQLPIRAHPSQGLRYRLRETLLRSRKKGMQEIFGKRSAD